MFGRIKNWVEAKRGNIGIGDLLPFALTIVVLGLAAAYSLDILGDIRDDMLVNTTADGANYTVSYPSEYNATSDTIAALAKIPDKLGTIADVVIAVVIIGVVMLLASVGKPKNDI